MNPHPLVSTYLQRKGLPPERLRADGGLSLSLGERARVTLQPLPGGGVLCEARIAPLPAPGRARAERVDALLRAAAARLRQHPQALVIDDTAEAFVLQQALDDGLSPVAFDDAVGAFFKAVLFWKQVEAAR